MLLIPANTNQWKLAAGLVLLCLSSVSVPAWADADLKLIGLSRAEVYARLGPPLRVVKSDKSKDVEVYSIGEISFSFRFDGEVVASPLYFATRSIPGLYDASGSLHEMTASNIEDILQAHARGGWSKLKPKVEFGPVVYLSPNQQYAAVQKGVILVVTDDDEIVANAVFRLKVQQAHQEQLSNPIQTTEPTTERYRQAEAKLVLSMFKPVFVGIKQDGMLQTFLVEANAGRESRGLPALKFESVKPGLLRYMDSIISLIVDGFSAEFTLEELKFLDEFMGTRVGQAFMASMVEKFNGGAGAAPDFSSISAADRAEVEAVYLKNVELTRTYGFRVSRVFTQARLKSQRFSEADLLEAAPPPVEKKQAPSGRVDK